MLMLDPVTQTTRSKMLRGTCMASAAVAGKVRTLRRPLIG